MTKRFARNRSFFYVRKVAEQLGIFIVAFGLTVKEYEKEKFLQKSQGGPRPAPSAIFFIFMGSSREFPLLFQQLRNISFLYTESIMLRSLMRLQRGSFHVMLPTRLQAGSSPAPPVRSELISWGWGGVGTMRTLAGLKWNCLRSMFRRAAEVVKRLCTCTSTISQH